ncbi:hypothetical protein CSB45_12250 [candidate division KSB3 bacterium]|uniref:Uncharacterized protein n=1 Tax=candidate division KSB3 bacterium TaxID=2044937 RepID=A0A2G6E2K6_9BACT|nr:MAG: hypothetical protein CSB45_12250 [candidate division KSB3 bacterium]PIE28867.1 MAG: hypothetical protein CSA57_11925 [candidate division KSB3 bacterium]
MGCFKFILLPLLVGGTLLATVSTFSHLGIPDIEEPQGIDLRQESANYRRGAFFAYYGRSHMGGGLRGGK